MKLTQLSLPVGLLAAGLLTLCGGPARAQTLESLFDPYTFTSPVSGTMPYRLMEPEGFDPGESYPLLVVLHGLGGKGTDNLAQLGMGAPQTDAYVRTNFKSYTLLPQGSDGDFQSFGLWGDPASKSMAAQPTGSGRMTLELVDHLIATNPAIDPARVYLVGQSMGGSGVFELLARRPDLFACGVPVYLGGTPDTCSAIAAADIPIRLMNNDQSIPWSRDRLLLLGADVAHIAKFTGDTGHGAYTNLYAHDDYALFRWMFEQRQDGPRVRVRHTDGATVVVEYGAADACEVWLKTQPAADVVVTPLPDSQVATSPVTLTFTPANWAVKQTVALSAVNDTVTEGTHAGRVDFAAASADADYNGVLIQQIEAVVQEGDAAVCFSSVGWTVGESDGSVGLTVQLEGNVTGAVSVDFATFAAGGATEGADYMPVSGTLSWPEGDRSDRQIVVPILDDALSEGAEAFEVRLSNGVGVQAGDPATATVHISDDEYAGVLRIVSRYATVSESSPDITFTVARADGSLGPASVQVATVNGTAQAGSDFSALSQTLSWADGDQEEKAVTIFLIDDAIPEPAETFSLVLSNATGAGLGEPDSVVVTIEDDDGFVVTLTDAFDDSGRSDGDDPDDADWWYEKSFPSTDARQLAVRSGSGLANAISFNSNNNLASFFAALSETVTLANVGDFIEVTFHYSRSASPSFNSGLRIGFFQQGSPPTGDNYGAGFDPATGYLAGFASGGNVNSKIRKDSLTTDNLLNDGQGSTTGQLLNATDAGLKVPLTGQVPDQLPATIRFRLERVDNGIQITAAMTPAGGVETTMSIVDASAPITTFNAIGLGVCYANQMNYFDNFAVTSGGPVVYSPDHDADGDGQSDYDEYVAGTDPNSGASFFNADLVPHPGGGLVIAFPTIPGREYAVEACDALTPAAEWEPIFPWTPGTGAALEIPVAAPAPHLFHRVKARIP